MPEKKPEEARSVSYTGDHRKVEKKDEKKPATPAVRDVDKVTKVEKPAT